VIAVQCSLFTVIILTQLRRYTINEDGSESLVSFSEQEEEAASHRRFCRSFIE
jgi:hypothetical protein